MQNYIMQNYIIISIPATFSAKKSFYCPAEMAEMAEIIFPEMLSKKREVYKRKAIYSFVFLSFY